MLQILRILVFCVGCLPLPVRALLGKGVAAFFSLVPTRDCKIAKLQIETFLPPDVEKPPIWRVYGSMGETLLESINLAPMLADYQKYVSADWSQWDSILAQKKGILILSAHTGNWDLLAACSVKRGYKLSVIGGEMQSGALQTLMEKVRANYGATTVWRADASGMRTIIASLKKGESVAALIDQDTRVSSHMIPFFGTPAATPSSIIDLARRCDAVIVAPFIFRTGLNRYQIIVKEFDSSLPTDEILMRFNETLEGIIKKYPWQWVWIHKRWRTLENGERLPSRKYLEYLKERKSSKSSADPQKSTRI